MKPEGRKIVHKVMTQADLDKAAAEADAQPDAIIPIVDDMPDAMRAEADAVVEPKTETTPEPEKAPAPTPPEVQPNVELDSLKAELAEARAKNEELTKRLRDDDGRRGGELAQLRQANENLGNQLLALTEEVRQSRKATPPPAPNSSLAAQEPDPLAEYAPDIRDGVRKIADAQVQPLRAELERVKADAEAKSKAATELAQRAAYSQFLAEVKAEVKNLEERNNDPKFIEWCQGTNPGALHTRQEVLDKCAATFNSTPVVQLFQQYENETKPATATPIEPPKGPAKPSKEAQVEIPTTTDKVEKAPEAPKKSRMNALYHKIFKAGSATKADYEEYYRLADLEEQGKLV